MSRNHFCRKGCRGLALASTIVLIVLDYLFTIKLAGKTGSIRARAIWMRRQANRLLRALAIEPIYHGEPPTQGVMVTNHLSYTDILVLASRHPLVFISKAEVAQWPIFGMLSQFAGTLFIRRDLRSDVLRVGAEMPRVLEAGIVLAFFPEGTSTGGDRVLPFRASLFASVVNNGWTITPAVLRYELDPDDGSVADEVAYWRDMSFGPHLLNLLGKRNIRAIVTYGKPTQSGADRKALALRLHDEVCQLGGLAVDQSAVAE